MPIVIEMFVYVCITAITVFCLYRQNRGHLTKTSDFTYVVLIFSLTLAQVLIQISPEGVGGIHLLTQILLGVLFACAIVYLLIRQRGGSPETRETARVWITWTLFLVFAVSTWMLVTERLASETVPLFSVRATLAICLAMAYCPPAFDLLKTPEDDEEKYSSGEEDRSEEPIIIDDSDIIDDTKPTINPPAEIIKTLETGLETHKESIINLAIESWRFAKGFERLLRQVDVAQPKRYESQIKWITKQTEDSLADVGLRIANVEGHPYEVGIPATPMNIEDFDPDDTLEVDLMLEPIIMEGTVPINTGKITLRKIDS